jgi:son of sevenless
MRILVNPLLKWDMLFCCCSDYHQSDTKFNVTFMMTYKSFTTLDELFDRLVARFHLKAPDGLNSKERDEWTKLKQQIVQTRQVGMHP